MLRCSLALHEGHLVSPNALDRGFVTGHVVTALGKALDAAGWRARLSQIGQHGVTDVVYQPSGPDIPRELRAFAEMAGLSPRA